MAKFDEQNKKLNESSANENCRSRGTLQLGSSASSAIVRFASGVLFTLLSLASLFAGKSGLSDLFLLIGILSFTSGGSALDRYLKQRRRNSTPENC